MLEDTRFPGVAAVWHRAEMLSTASPRTPLCARWLLLSLFHPLSNTVSENLSSFFHQLVILILRKNHQAHTIGPLFFSFFLSSTRSPPFSAIPPTRLSLRCFSIRLAPLNKKKKGGGVAALSDREKSCAHPQSINFTSGVTNSGFHFFVFFFLRARSCGPFSPFKPNTDPPQEVWCHYQAIKTKWLPFPSKRPRLATGSLAKLREKGLFLEPSPLNMCLFSFLAKPGV